MLQQIINLLFVSSIGTTFYMSYEVLTGTYQLILFGIANPLLSLGIIYIALIGIYVFVLSTKVIANKIISFILPENAEIQDNSETGNRRQRLRKNIKGSANTFISGLQLMAAILTCVTSFGVFYKELHLQETIKLTDYVKLDRIYTLEDKIEWLSYLRHNETLSQIPEDVWSKITKDIPWSNFNNINGLKTHLLVEFKKYIDTLPVAQESGPSKIFEQIGHFIINTVKEHPYITGAIVVAIIGGICYYHYSYASEITSQVKGVNNRLIESDKCVNQLTDGVSSQATNQNELVNIISNHTTDIANLKEGFTTMATMVNSNLSEGSNHIKGLLETSREHYENHQKQQFDSIWDAIKDLAQCTQTKLDAFNSNICVKLENLSTNVTNLEAKVNKIQASLRETNINVTELSQTLEQVAEQAITEILKIGT